MKQPADLLAPPLRSSQSVFLLVATGLLLSGCGSQHFASSEQRERFDEVLAYADKVSRPNYPERILGNSADDQGLLILFDTNGKKVTAKYLVRGNTSDAAMQILLKNTTDPCASGGANATIAAFIPPTTVDLPISIFRCAMLADRVRGDLMTAAELRRLGMLLDLQATINTANRDVLRKLLVATTTHSSELHSLAVDLDGISKIQQNSWDRAIALLMEMVQRIKGRTGR